MSLGRYYHTLRHLRPVQFYGRVVHRVHRPRPDTRPAPPIRPAAAAFPLPPYRPPSMLGPDRLRFLNVERTIASPGHWNDPAAEKLWLYNLHYFDDLNAEGRDAREPWHRALIARWMAENPPGHGNGWEPYPISLRLVNIIKWARAGFDMPTDAAQSLAVQARFLMQRLEWHLLGNHLWTNGKALVFAGVFFAGPEADRWRATGLQIVEAQLSEQVLPDGGHFERSPMYHSTFIEDLLDLVALTHCHPGVIPDATVAAWRDKIGTMLGWLDVMTHPDGGIALFNDTAPDIAAPPATLHALAAALGIAAPAARSAALRALEDSGYVRLQSGDFVLIADVGPIGPDYIPGHAHADTLSFELSWRGRRVLGNSGTSCYGTSAQRQRERGTAAHNALTIDDADSSEVWHGFRVARRAHPHDLQLANGPTVLRLRCEHDGYARLPGRPIHRREWRMDRTGVAIRDEVRGSGVHVVTGHLHVQPGIEVAQFDPHRVALTVPGAGQLELRIEAPLAFAIREGHFAPGFGRLESRPVVTWQQRGTLPTHANIEIRAQD